MIAPPCYLVAGLMQLPMMTAAERYGELVADFETQSSGLGKPQVMRIGRSLAISMDLSDILTIKLIAKFCSVAAIVLVVITALGPANWQARTGLGWEIDHFLGYFAITLLVCLAWPRPFVVGALMAVAALLEGLQALTPDRTSNLFAAFYGASGALAAALRAELFIRARRRRAS
jgi:VanZ family protein